MKRIPIAKVKKLLVLLAFFLCGMLAAYLEGAP